MTVGSDCTLEKRVIFNAVNELVLYKSLNSDVRPSVEMITWQLTLQNLEAGSIMMVVAVTQQFHSANLLVLICRLSFSFFKYVTTN